ncbi:MAG: PDZ domain-containing protein [Bacteroidota bacterium]
MNFQVKVGLVLSAFFLCIGMSGLMAQNQKRVTVNITIEGDGYKTRIDTSFLVNDEAEADRIIDELVDSKYPDQNKMEKVVIIKEDDGSYNKPKPRKKTKAMMGVFLSTDHNNEGVRITSVVDGGAAKEGGLRGGDIIKEIDGVRIKTYDELVKAKQAYEPGDRMRVKYARDGRNYSTSINLKGEKKETIVFEERQAPMQTGEKAFLGVYPDEVSPSKARELGLTSQQGVYLDGIVPYSGAYEGGLKKGDILVRINGRRLDSSWDLADALKENAPGETIAVTYYRDGKECETEVKLTDHETVKKRKPVKKKVKTEKAFLGVYLENQAGGGVTITGVVDNSAAENAGLERGDVIMSLGDFRTDTYHDLSDAMKKFRPDQNIRVVFEREGRRRTTNLVMGKKVIEKWVEVRPGEENSWEEENEEEEFEEEEEQVDLDEMIRQFDDREKGRQVASFMENPTLDMDLFEFFPNPNNGRFTLRFQPSRRGDLQIRIYSANGAEIYQEFIQDFFGEYNKEINISRNAPKGIYFLQLTQGERGMVQRIIVK